MTTTTHPTHASVIGTARRVSETDAMVAFSRGATILARVTGRRRTGTIRRGVCTSCGHGAR